MTWSISGWWVSVIVVGMLCIPLAAAANEAGTESGRITFVGTVVEPTCSATIATMGAVASIPASPDARQHRLTCDAAGMNAGFRGSYALTVVTLDESTIGGDRVLEYFADYVNAAGNTEAKPMLVTQVFD